MLGIELTEKLSGFVAVIYACYLPPENSVWGYGSTNIFAHLSSELYLNANADFVLFCGDYDGRIWDLSDTIENIYTDVPTRYVIDWPC